MLHALVIHLARPVSVMGQPMNVKCNFYITLGPDVRLPSVLT